MSTPGDDADAIRNKRLARLQAFQRPSSTEADASSSSSSTSDVPKPAPSPVPAPPSPSPAVRRSPAPSIPLKTSSQPSRPSTPSSPGPNADGLTPTEAWEDRTLSHIFRVTVRPTSKTALDKYLSPEELRKDLAEQAEGSGKAPHLTVEALDQLVLSLCSEKGVVPMDHLIGSWRRSKKLERDTPAARLDERKLHILKESQRISLSYAVYCVTMPEMFGGNQPPVDLSARLLADMNDDRGLPQDVLVEFANRLEEEPDLKDKFRTAFKMMSTQMLLTDMAGDYKPHLHALGRIAHIKPLAEIYVHMPEFLNDVKPEQMEVAMSLGPYFRLSPLQSSVAGNYFMNAKAKPGIQIREAQNALQLATRALQTDLAQITTAFCRTSGKGRVLDFFAKVLNANHKRAAMHVDYKTVSSDGFMLNINAVLQKLCMPFMDSTFSKIDRVDVAYFRRNPRIDISEETKMNAESKASEEYYANNKVEGENHFITEVFFLAAASHHYALVSTQNSFENLERDIPELERHIQRMEADRPKYQGFQLAQLEHSIKKFKDQLDAGYSTKCAMECLLWDPALAAITLLFTRYQLVWLLRVMDPKHMYPHKLLELPLPEPAPEVFNNLPEYMVEDVGELLTFIGHYTPEVLVSTQLSEIVIFAVTLLRSNAYVLKPGIKSKLVEILFLGTLSTRGGAPGYLMELIHGHPFVLQHLMHALANMYIDIEKRYYEKFTVRYHISKIIQQIWTNPKYREKLEQESEKNHDFFVQFVALLLNDVSYTLDHALTALLEVHKLQKELKFNREALTVEEVAEKEKALAKNEKEATSYMQLGNETVTLFNMFTSAIPDAFCVPEVVNRLASMLDFNLEMLTGSQCRNLKVENPEKYRFNPRALLGEITTVYLNLASKSTFIQAIAKDGRSYKPQTFEKAVDIMKKHNLKAKDEIEAFEKLASAAAKEKKLEDDLEELLGDFPDEFGDPVMTTLMTDPVILPSSRVTVDRQTIASHLLNDPKDPFNRQPLKIDDVIPDTELKAKIDAWIEERKEAARIARQGTATPKVEEPQEVAEADKMEVDE